MAENPINIIIAALKDAGYEPKTQLTGYLLMIPNDKVFKTKELSAQIGSSRLSFADAEYMEKYLDITPGSVSVMGLINDTERHVRLLVDEDVLQGEFLGCHPCINTSSIRLLYYGDWIKTPGVAICSCNDGLRPVIFKLEATDEKSEMDYMPIQNSPEQ